MFVGESPGRTEEEEGKPFVGDAGDVLRRNAKAAKIDIKKCVIANSARCLINKKKLGQKDITQILKSCRPFLEQAILKVNPKIIVLLGDFALRQVLKTSGITKKRGSLEWSKEFNCWCLPMFHPAYILRNRAMEPRFKEDMEYLKTIIDNDYRLDVAQGSNKKYKIVNTIRPLLDKADSGTKFRVGLDCETQGLDYVSPDSFVISYSVSHKANYGYQIFLHEKASLIEAEFAVGEGNVRVGVKKCDGFETKMNELMELITHPNILIYMQNGNYDQHHLRELFRRSGRKPPDFTKYVMDVQAGAHVLDENLFVQSSLDELARSFLKVNSDWKKDFYDKYNKDMMINVPKDDLTKYATEDADNTLQIGLKIKKQLEKNPDLLRYFTHAVMPVLSKALFALEETGVYVDPKQIKPTRDKINAAVEEFTNEAMSFVPPRVLRDHEEKGLRLTRQDLVRDALYGEHGYDIEPRFFSKSGAPSTSSETRTDLLSQDIPEDARKFLDAYEDWSEWNTLKTRALKQLVESIRHDGRIHTSFNLVRAVTGRVASSNPNLMNIPNRTSTAKEVRKLISAPKGYVLIEVDESQSELRWMAHMSGDKEMLRVYRNNEDIHLNTAKALTKNYDRLSKEEQKQARTAAKPANFGLIYGSSANGFARYCRFKFGIDINKFQAEEIMDKWFMTYPGVETYQKQMIEFCVQDGFVSSLLGRRRRLPGIYSKDFRERGDAERQAINHPIQSASSDTVLLALVEILKDKRINPEECRPVLFVHDSIILECREDKVDKYIPIIRWHLENPPLKKLFGIKLRVPMVADAKVGPNLGEMEEV